MSLKKLISLLVVGLSRLISGTSVRWVDYEPSTAQRIYFANHSSHLDFIVLWAALPGNIRNTIRPIAAKDYWEKNTIRRFLSEKVFNAILVARPGAESGQRDSSKGITEMYGALGAGSSLIIFPEGTRELCGAISEFKPGLYHLAKHCPAAELVPVFLENLNRILPKGETLPVPFLGGVTFGSPLKLKCDESRDDFLTRAKQSIEQLMEM